MRRLGILAVIAVAAAAAVLASQGDNASSGYRVDAIFDTARGVSPGQLVKIAGAQTGEIVAVQLTDDFKARVQMTVEEQFAPFRSDARCEIQPEGLISENFVQCSPGTPEGEELREQDGEEPTVPVENTAVPVNFTDLFNIFTVPVRDRLRFVLAALGGGVATRGDELNELLQRANPTLREVRRLTAILDDQRVNLASAVEDTDAVVGDLARRRDDVQALVEQGSRLTARTARRSEELRATVRGLPALLAATRPALTRLDELAASATPTLRNLRAGAPGVEQAVRDLGPFARAATPAIDRLGDVAVAGRRTARRTADEVRLARRFALAAENPVALTEDLVVSLRDRGGVEGLLEFAYRFAAGSARYDDISHILPAHIIQTGCEQFATSPAPGCSANYGGSSASAPERRERRRSAATRPAPAAPATPAPAPPPAPAAPSAPAPEPRGEGILDGLLPELPARPPLPLGERPQQQDSPGAALLDYLLG